MKSISVETPSHFVRLAFRNWKPFSGATLRFIYFKYG